MLGGGWGGVGQCSDLRGEGRLVKIEGMLSLRHLERQRVCHDITKSAESQTNTNFSDNDCMTAEILPKHLSSE